MIKVIIVYDTKYGNTKLVAETILDQMKEFEKIEAGIKDLKDASPNILTDYDAILIGGPNHFGSPSRTIMKFIDNAGKLNLGERKIAVFDTYMGKDFEKTVKKMEARIKERVPQLRLMSPGASIRVEGLKGPISEGELPKAKEFGRRIADQL